MEIEVSVLYDKAKWGLAKTDPELGTLKRESLARWQNDPPRM